VTKVKFQGRCGACWAFAAAGAVESLNAIKGTSVPMDLSPQELVVQGMEGNLSGPQHSPRPVHRRRLRAGAVLPQRPTDVCSESPAGGGRHRRQRSIVRPLPWRRVPRALWPLS
jgi:hypothetical protein